MILSLDLPVIAKLMYITHLPSPDKYEYEKTAYSLRNLFEIFRVIMGEKTRGLITMEPLIEIG